VQRICCSLPQDLNAIETAWRELRARLDETMPTGRETRAAFLARLRRAVAWVNVHRGEYFQEPFSARGTGREGKRREKKRLELFKIHMCSLANR